MLLWLLMLDISGSGHKIIYLQYGRILRRQSNLFDGTQSSDVYIASMMTNLLSLS